MTSVSTRLRAWLVRDRDDALRRRRPGDLVRALVASALFAILALHAGHYYTWERAFTRFLVALPDDIHSLARLAYGLLALWAVGLAVVAAVLARRWRLARDVAVAGVGAWVLGRALAFVVHDTDLAHAFRIVWDARGAPPFPLVRVAMGVAVISVAGGYLTRPTRWVGRSLVIALGVVALYLGHAYVTDLLGAVVLGWGVANLVKFAFGTPIGRPTVGNVGRALAALGVEVSMLRPAAAQPLGRARFVAERSDDGATLQIVALGRDEADAQLLARAWRYVAYRDSAPTLFPTRRQQIEYEAFVCLLAAQAGVRVNQVAAAGVSGSIALLATVDPPGVPLAELAPDDVSDALLDDTWQQVETMHRANVVHGALDATHVVVTDGSAALVGWRHAVATSSSHQIGRDRANLLAASSVFVGPERAVAAARRAVADDALAALMPMLQPPALTDGTREALEVADAADDIDAALSRLARHVGTATATEVPEPRRLYRVAPRQLLMAVGALFAVGVLLSRIGDPQEFWNSIRDANWAYVALAFLLGLGTDAAFAVAFMGTVPVRLPLWPCIELQSSLSFANLAVPIAADTAIQIRFLQKHGLDLSEAVATGGILSTVSEIIVQLGLLVVALWLAPDTIDFGHIDTNQVVVIIAIVIFVVGVASAIGFGVRRIRARLLPPIVRALRAVWMSVKSPSRIALMIGGNVLAQCLYAASLLACLHAFGASVDFWTLLALNIGISLIASLVPIPGGSTAVSAIGLSGMLVTFGVPAAAATAAVLAHQVAVTYLPAIPGWFAGNDLSRRRLL